MVQWTTPCWGGKLQTQKAQVEDAKRHKRLRVLITTVQVPFIRGGAEVHAEGLRDALRRFGHEAEILAIPFKWYPPEKILDHMLACQLLDVSEIGRASCRERV